MSSLKVRPGCGGLNIELMVTSVVILIVRQYGIAVFKRKSQTLVAVHVFRPLGSIERNKLPIQAWGVSSLNACA